MKLLFDTQDRPTKRLIGRDLEVNLRDGAVDIYRNYEYIETKQLKTSFEKRLAVVQLVNNYGAMRTRLSEAFSISRQSINNWIDSYEKEGALGLINNTKDSWKKNPHRFQGHKAASLEQDRLEQREAENQAQAKGKAATELNIFPSPEVVRPKIKTDLYSTNYRFENNRYAGSMILMGMLEHLYDFHQTAAESYGEELTFLYLFIQMHTLQIESIEQLKVLQKHEFGRVIGMEKLPSIPNVWKAVHAGVAQKKVEIFKAKVFDYQILNGLVGLDGLAFDGHFIPYYGKEKIHKGFYTQRGAMFKGQTQMFLHDASGRVIYFDTQEGKGDIVKSLKTASTYVSGLNAGQKPLIAIDREVWGVENFKYLSEERIVTWEKHVKSADLAKIDIALFEQDTSGQLPNWKLYEQTKLYKDAQANEVTLRRVILHNNLTQKRLSMVSTDQEADKLHIATVMLNRWASNENSFKYMGTRTQMHYNPAIEIVQQSEQQEIQNPVYKDKHKELAKEKKELAKTQRTIGKIPITINKDGGIRNNKHRTDLNKKVLDLKQNIQLLNEQLEDIPQRIDINEIGGTSFKVIDKEGINIWGICETVFWNTRKELIQRFSQYLPNHRDTIPVLETLIKAPGKISSSSTLILVKMETLKVPRYRSAQIQLLRFMNHLNVRINGKLLQFGWDVL